MMGPSLKSAPRNRTSPRLETLEVQLSGPPATSHVTQVLAQAAQPSAPLGCPGVTAATVHGGQRNDVCGIHSFSAHHR